MKSQWTGFRGPLAGEIRAFIDDKRALGRRYSTEEKQLRVFDAWLVRRGLTRTADITPEVIGTFLSSLPRPRPRSHNAMLGVIRRLFDWLVRQGRLSASPVRAKPRPSTSRRIPYLFGPEDAKRLLEVAESLQDNPRAPLRGSTYKTIFALLYGLGLRVGEVSRLLRADVNLDRDLLVIRDTKFGKSRLVPFGPRIGAMLRAYLDLLSSSTGSALFSFTDRGAIHPGTISQTFHHLVPRLALVVPEGVQPPVVHDLRHSFAVGTLLRWYRDGLDPAARLFHLATFLGHVNPSSTAIYLTITNHLLTAANSRFEGFAAPTLREVAS